MTAFARDHGMLVHPIRGGFYDCGSPEGLHAANSALAAEPCP
ncbi:hypothetical protein ACGFZP_37835 [Kitasatospora sp. NPDC048239]